MIYLWIILVLAILVVWGRILFVDIKRYRAQVDNAWAQVNVQLEHRQDIASELLEVVRGYVNGQVRPLEEAIKARRESAAAREIVALRQGEEELTCALETLYDVAGELGEVKSDSNFTELSKRLSVVSDRIQLVNRFYNDQVLVYNTRVELMPRKLVARLAGFRQAEFFDVRGCSPRVS